MAAERDLELLDDYLGNRMDETSRAAFEQKISADQSLRSELNLQQQMISGIKKARVAELKGMLNNIPVPAGHTTGAAVGTKVALWVAVAGLVATGVYLYVDEPSEKSVTPSTENTVTPAKEETQPEKAEENPNEQNHEDAPVGASQESSSEKKPVAPPKPGRKAATQEASREIEVYDPTEELQEDNNQAATEQLSQSHASPTPSVSVDIDSENKKYNFHYQFKEGKLLLYGPFEKDLYEIMEFFNEEKRTLFLYYKDNYYLLKDNNASLKPLNAIQDTVLLNRLKNYRNP